MIDTTPRPWMIKPTNSKADCELFGGLPEEFYVGTILDRDDADLICRAVNAFDDMVSALRRTKEMLASDTIPYALDYPEVLEIIDELSDLLQKIEGKEEVAA